MDVNNMKVNTIISTLVAIVIVTTIWFVTLEYATNKVDTPVLNSTVPTSTEILTSTEIPTTEESIMLNSTPESILTIENVTPVRPPKPIYIMSYSMDPKTPTIYTGEALNWINFQKSPCYDDFVLVSGDGLWENKTISYGKMFLYTFNTSGNYTYYCVSHGSTMYGTVTVLEVQP